MRGESGAALLIEFQNYIVYFNLSVAGKLVFVCYVKFICIVIRPLYSYDIKSHFRICIFAFFS